MGSSSQSDDQSKPSIIAIAKKHLAGMEEKLDELVKEIRELRQLFNHFPEGLEHIYSDKTTPVEPEEQKPAKVKKKKIEQAEHTQPAKPAPESSEPAKIFSEPSIPFEPEKFRAAGPAPTPKPPKPPVDQEEELSPAELDVLGFISGLEDSEHMLVIARHLNMNFVQVKNALEQLLKKGLVYSPDASIPDAEFYIDQKGLEYLAKQELT
jgi:hypothetical protein